MFVDYQITINAVLYCQGQTLYTISEKILLLVCFLDSFQEENVKDIRRYFFVIDCI